MNTSLYSSITSVDIIVVFTEFIVSKPCSMHVCADSNGAWCPSITLKLMTHFLWFMRHLRLHLPLTFTILPSYIFNLVEESFESASVVCCISHKSLNAITLQLAPVSI